MDPVLIQACHDSLQVGPAQCAGIDLRGWNPQLEAYEDGDFTGAVLDGVHFGNASFMRSDFTGASLIGAEIQGQMGAMPPIGWANWSFAILRNANLRNASFVEVVFQETDFSNSIFAGVDTSWVYFWGSTFSTGADLTGISFSSYSEDSFDWAILPGVNLSGLNLRLMAFRNAILSNANFRNADLYWAEFGSATLDGADFTSADLYRSSFVDANLSGADFANANLTMVDFTGATLDGASFSGALNCGGATWGRDFPPSCD
ncbi:MAG: pentapeptide repeat-containing protein [Actinobacteria bacterium]|nr:pentapeptide repeat-containing protein [Actinomycetota bacterium]